MKKDLNRIYNAVDKEILSAESFLETLKKDSENIKNVQFVLPKIGKQGDFGHFEVSYRSLVLR